jgi:hypothetical protein
MEISLNQLNYTKGEKMTQSITIKDDKGKERTFSKLDELVQFLDSFKMSFLPDRFTYKINKEKI